MSTNRRRHHAIVLSADFTKRYMLRLTAMSCGTAGLPLHAGTLVTFSAIMAVHACAKVALHHVCKLQPAYET
jgi:hypothetical protein